MSQVNQVMEDLANRLDGFNQAVSNGDLVGMKNQSDNAFKAIDDLNALEAPEELKRHSDGIRRWLQRSEDALSQYIDLYTEMENATEEEPFDLRRTIRASRRSRANTIAESISSKRAISWRTTRITRFPGLPGEP